jgi:hypothetical protein
MSYQKNFFNIKSFIGIAKEYKSLLICAIFSVIFLYVLFCSIKEAIQVAIPLWAVIWAVYHQEIKQYLHRPILEIIKFSQDVPYVRRAPIINTDWVGFFINIPLRNVGKRTAKNCQPIISAMGKIINGSWYQEKNWIPVALFWAGGEDFEYTDKGKKIREERELIPQRLYFFNLGHLTTEESDKFILDQIIILTAQDYKFDPGRYCFEVSVNAEEISSPLVKYFFVTWQGQCIDDLNSILGKLKIDEQQKAPW